MHNLHIFWYYSGGVKVCQDVAAPVASSYGTCTAIYSRYWDQFLSKLKCSQGKHLCYISYNLQHWVLRFLPKYSSSRARIWCYISCSLQHQVLRSIHCWNVAQPGLGFVLHVLQFTAPGTETKSLPKCSSNWARVCATFTAIYSNFNYWQVSPFGLNLGLQLANRCSSWCISHLFTWMYFIDLLRMNWGELRWEFRNLGHKGGC